MYGKVFSSMYEGSLYGQWQAIVTFQQMIVICDLDGSVDMTPAAISGRTSIPLEIIEKGLEELSKPDPASRSDDHEGRRIIPLDPSRPWGWRIVNYTYYRDIVKAIDKREADRERIARKRAKSQPVAECRGESQTVANSRASEAEAEAEVKTEESPRKRGSRLPGGWKPSDKEAEYAKGKGLDPDLVAEKFRNYWCAKAGNATKLDWTATWRNWCIDEAERSPRKPAVKREREPTPEEIRAARAVDAEKDRQQRERLGLSGVLKAVPQ